MEKESFSYTYSAKEQEEIKSIREKYAPGEQSIDKMSRLRRLDAAVTQKATAAALVSGILGALIMGSGMSLVMTDIGEALGAAAMPAGIVSGMAGLVLVCLAYPVYMRILRRERKKIAPEIIRLSDELTK